MWSNTDGQNIKKTISRIDKLNSQKPQKIYLLNTIFSYSYPPENISDKDFLDLKIDWLIKNKKDNVIEQFLKNNEFSK